MIALDLKRDTVRAKVPWSYPSSELGANGGRTFTQVSFVVKEIIPVLAM